MAPVIRRLKELCMTYVLIFIVIVLVITLTFSIKLGREIETDLNSVRADLALLERKLSVSINVIKERDLRIKELKASIEDGYGFKPDITINKIELNLNTEEQSHLLTCVDASLKVSTDITFMRSTITLYDKLLELFMKASDAEKEAAK